MLWSELFRFFYILGFVNALFFSILIFAKKDNSVADKTLASWLIVLSMQMLLPFILFSNVESYLPFLGLEIIIFLAHPVFLLLYILFLTKGIVSKKQVIRISAPFAVMLFMAIPFVNISPEQKLHLIQDTGFVSPLIYFGIVAIALYYTSYLILCFKNLKEHKTQTLHVFSYSDNVNLLWLRRILVSFTLFFALSLPIGIVLYLKGISLAYTDYFYYLTLVFFIFFIGFWGYQQGSIFGVSHISEAVSNSNQESLIKEQYTKEAVLLKSTMEKEKPFLDPTLTIHQLATQTNISVHQLSKTINKHFGKNFFEFINEYRIAEFKKRTANKKYQNYTLLGIALECGFNSKSAFNRIFKEQTGLTPGEYKRSI